MRDEYDFSAGNRGPVLKRPAKDGDSIVDLPVVCTLTPATMRPARLPCCRASSGGPTAGGRQQLECASGFQPTRCQRSWRPLMRSGNAVSSYGLTSPSSLTVARFGWSSPVRLARGSSYPRFSNREHESAGVRDGGVLRDRRMLCLLGGRVRLVADAVAPAPGKVVTGDWRDVVLTYLRICANVDPRLYPDGSSPTASSTAEH